MKKIFVSLLTFIVLFSNIVLAKSFSDVPQNAWYTMYVDDLSNKGVINGYEDGTYRPNDTLTYGAFIKLIMTASAPNIKYDLMFDLPFEHWAACYVKAAENYNVIEKGEITLENIDTEIPRMKVVNMLSKCDILIRENTQQSKYKSFTDISNISNDEFIYLSHAIAIGVIDGYEDGTFKPDDMLTRAAAAKIIYTYTNR